MGVPVAPLKRVVLVDDDDLVRLAMAAVVHDIPCEVVGEGRTGDEAVALFRAYRPDLLLLDVNMPGMSGTDALRQIRSEYPDACVIMLTAEADAETVANCVGLGAAGYILKSASVARIKVKILTAIGQTR